MGEYRENRPLWLEFSKTHLNKYPDRIERYNAFLRSCYPEQEGFSYKQLKAACEKLHAVITPDILIQVGNHVNWLTSYGKPFQSPETFCSTYNGVLIDMKRRNRLHVFEKRYLSDWKTEDEKLKEDYQNTLLWRKYDKENTNNSIRN